MKKVLIIGKNSYIGKNLKKYLELSSRSAGGEKFLADCVSGKEGEWQTWNFAGYDSVVLCSALVHRDEKKLGWPAYFEANAVLPVQIAQKAKAAGVGQFVFLSSLAVYGRSYEKIKATLAPRPETYYGHSKYLAEQCLLPMTTEDFAVAIVRPPMVYGAKAKGSYAALQRLAMAFPFFPKIENQKSVISIQGLCRTLKEIIQGRARGILHPQDASYRSTSELMDMAAKERGRKICFFPFPARLSSCLAGSCRCWNKAFGNLTIEREGEEPALGEKDGLL